MGDVSALTRNETDLSCATVGNTVRVAAVLGDTTFRSRMIAMGIMPGVQISIVEGGGHRPLLLALPGGRLMLDSGSARLIRVRASRAERGMYDRVR